MEQSLLNQGFTLMLVGMGTVFTFLTILVGGMTAMATVVRRFTPASAATDATDEEIAAISAAIAEHRKNRHG